MLFSAVDKMKSNFLNMFKSSLLDLSKNPIIIIPSIFLLIFSIAFSELSVIVNYSLQTTAALTTWLVFFSFTYLVVLAFSLSALIGASYKAVIKKARLKDIFYYSRKFWFRNLIIIMTIIILYNIVRYVAHNAALLIGTSLNLELNLAKGLFFLLYFTGLAGLIVFLTFSNFFLVIYNLNIFHSIKRSISLVKKEYIYTLSIVLIFFIINEFLKYIDRKLIELITNLFILPCLSLILTRFVLMHSKNDLSAK